MVGFNRFIISKKQFNWFLQNMKENDMNKNLKKLIQTQSIGESSKNIKEDVKDLRMFMYKRDISNS